METPPRGGEETRPSSPAQRSSSEPVAVLYVSSSGNLGGAEQSLLQLITHLDRSRVKAMLVLPQGEGDEFFFAAEARGIPVQTLPMVPLRRTRNPLRLLAALRDLRQSSRRIHRIARETGARLVHANTTRAALQAAFPPRKGGGVPLLWHNRDLNLPFLAGQTLGRSARAAIAVSAPVRELTGRYLPRDRIALIQGGVDLSPYARLPGREEARASLGISPEGPLLLCVAQHARWKRQDLFLDILARIREIHPDARGLLAARSAPPRTRTFFETLQNHARRLGLQRAVIFRAFLPEQMPAVYAAGDVLVHMAEREPFGRALVEALASGLPIVAARGGGPDAILEVGGGILTEPGNLDAALQSTLAYLRDGEARQRLVEGRLERASRFSAEGAAQKIASLYEALEGEEYAPPSAPF
ncbi:MAG: glycosyltransferase family 4 protein [Planctomycetota bacterium]